MGKSTIERAMEAIEKDRGTPPLLGSQSYVLDVPECKTSIYLNQQNRKALNVEKVRGYFETHLGCSAKEASHALELSYDCVVRAVQVLRSEWQDKK